MEKECKEKDSDKGETCAKCARKHSTSSCEENEKQCINCIKKNHDETDHAAYDPNCPVYKVEKSRIINQTDHGF